MKDRLLQLLTSENMTALKFAEIMEIRPSNVSHILSGRNNPSFDFVARLLRRFPELSPDWVLNGVGDMYRAGFKHDFAGMGDEGADEATAVATLFSDDAPAISVEGPADTVLLAPTMPLNATQMPASTTSALATPAGISAETMAVSPVTTHDEAVNSLDSAPNPAGDVNEHTEELGSVPAQNNTERIVANDAQYAQKLVIIYADNTFEVLTPKPR